MRLLVAVDEDASLERFACKPPEDVNDLAIDEESVHGKNAKITKFIDGLTNPAPNEEGRALPQGQLGPRSTANPEAKRIEPSRTR